MTSDDLSHIERELSLTLPVGYRQLMLDYPDWLTDDNREHALYDNVERIIGGTTFLRSEQAAHQKMPLHYLLLGDSGCGDIYALDLSETPASVMMWDGDTDCWDETQPDLDAYLVELRSINDQIQSQRNPSGG